MLFTPLIKCHMKDFQYNTYFILNYWEFHHLL
jgi:hypothetical protein